jgi:hypothetical protein
MRFVLKEVIVYTKISVENIYKFQFLFNAFRSMKMAFFWGVSPFSPVEMYKRFRGAYFRHQEGDNRPDDGDSMHH